MIVSIRSRGCMSLRNVAVKRLVLLGFLTLGLYPTLSNVEFRARPSLSNRAPAPPPQPSSGPGGADYEWDRIERTSYGQGSRQYWIFEPSPRPVSAPVTAFLHGWGTMSPESYIKWIEHLVRHGNVVIFPRYQEGVADLAGNMTPAALEAIRDAFRRLDGSVHTRADRGRFAVVGYSLGGVIAANIAGLASEAGIPAPKALMIVQPGDIHENPLLGILGDCGRIDRDTLLLVLVGEEDDVVGNATALRIYDSVSQIPATNRDFVTVRSDYYGRPYLIADHFAPVAAAIEVDALDYYGFWKLFDGLTSATFFGTYRDYALGNTYHQTYMGEWSDGVPVTPLLVTD